MATFWTRTRRYMAVLWAGTIVLELAALEMARRTNDSWFLLLALAILLIPIAGAEMTWRWVSRPPRRRWKRHDLEDAARLATAAPTGATAAETPLVADIPAP